MHWIHATDFEPAIDLKTAQGARSDGSAVTAAAHGRGV